MKPDSKVFVYGHTDRMGDDNYNLKLSKQRAQAVAKEFTDYDVTVNGFGEAELMYDNDLPEGRFYCRKVDIVIETPVEY
jgi:OOP family OmpA-OmpF porin